MTRVEKVEVDLGSYLVMAYSAVSKLPMPVPKSECGSRQI